ncbi:hypothetical protein LWI28_006157 [Acer negundo]|uniref:Uncharacterized protein n=1 Tax=Acer negundo TaxID=4023 RepID=A0AAD5I554_ACENE|nr:hypothetical protein LWI28_006157 [Acer negundo]
MHRRGKFGLEIRPYMMWQRLMQVVARYVNLALGSHIDLMEFDDPEDNNQCKLERDFEKLTSGSRIDLWNNGSSDIPTTTVDSPVSVQPILDDDTFHFSSSQNSPLPVLEPPSGHNDLSSSSTIYNAFNPPDSMATTRFP